MAINLRTAQGWQDLKAILDDRPGDVLRICKLDVGARRSTAVIDDPRGSGHGNFAIWQKADGLSWKNYTTGECGRSLELIAYCQGWYHLNRRGAQEAANWAIDMLGLGRISQAELDRDRAKSFAVQARARNTQAEELRRKQGRAFYTFAKEAVPIIGTGGEIYLREARGIDLRKAPFLGPRNGLIVPHALRFKASHKYIHRNKRGDKVGESFHPAIIACCVDGAMKVKAIHQTYLRDDFSDKADIPPAPDGYEQKARKIWPDSLGLVIPLWRGEGHYSPADAAQLGLVETLSLSEGVEDGLSEVLAAPQHRTWAMLSLSNMVHVAGRLPACCDSVIVHRQNDWQKPEAIAQFDRGMAAIRATGRAAAEVAAVIGKDLNDTLRGAA
ncbi:DUF7146 domain-containing protein [Afipia felis]|uniref:Uncharacterized protein conserved in bacteria n=2 Tax=Afipia felis TaxID=1035 RepID=A0A381AYS1_AFIFE|nr:toprim domain-containing protein [Afipia felis]EKS26701.1 hypothetical protein HMPREF9697_04004 [Afipia felis ATCC 53690]SUU76150.1 Uncharacterized protein conserved in bacteria [Afipia felis]SUU84217.1 Uncharacterized protein conserved in bacteria [Afipia felis]SUW28218.1 Uncharacterized protein conserved in bacteria [Afipia felis]